MSWPILRLQARSRRPQRRGAILILGAFLIFVFCGLAAFAIDLGFIALSAAQLQNAADAAALAAVLELKTADPSMTQADLRALAVAEAKKVALMNEAAGRPVELRDVDIIFGNRHFDPGTGAWVTYMEGDPALGDLPLNAIEVSVAFDEASGNRRELDLWFARLINNNTAAISALARSHLTPRDLAFIIDISNSMNDDSQNNAGREAIARALLDYPSGAIPGNTFLEFDAWNRGGVAGDSTNRDVLLAGSQIQGNAGGAIRINSANHGLIDGDVVRLFNAGQAVGGASAGSFAVDVINANYFDLVGSTYNGAGSKNGPSGVDGGLARWFVKSIYPSPDRPGECRMRTNTPHGLNDTVRVDVREADGVPGAVGVFDVAVVDNERIDLVGSNFNGATIDAFVNDTGVYRLHDWAPRQGPYKLLWLRTLDPDGPEIGTVGSANNSVWINPEKAEEFAAGEFASGTFDASYPNPGDYNHPQYHNNGSTGPQYDYAQGHPWRHWKWQTYCDWTYIADDGVLLPGNVNVISGNGNGSRRYSLDRYARFVMPNGYLPAMRGQMVFGRDMDMDGTYDSFPPPDQSGETYADYPDYEGFYGKSAYLAGYDSSVIDFTEGSPVAGLHPMNIPDEPFTFVRQATLLGIHAMISDENAGNDAFDQVGMVTYGTRAFVELDLGNDLVEAIKRGNNRSSVTGANMGITPHGNGNTNIGGAIRTGLDLLLYSPRSRAWTEKTLALLTDGNPNISPQGGFEADEYDPISKVDTVVNNVGLGANYARYWASQAAAEGVVIHTITVGNNANTGLMQEIADTTGGFYFRVDDPATQQDQLNDIFIAIGKDKLGKLFGN